MGQEKVKADTPTTRLTEEDKYNLRKAIDDAARRARQRVISTSQALRAPVPGNKSKHPGKLEDPTLDL